MKRLLAQLPTCCPAILQGRLSQAEAECLAGIFKAIADPARLRLLSFIAAQPSGEAYVGYLMKPLDMSEPTVSHHLKVLYDAGLLERERRGKCVYYRIVLEGLAALRNALGAGPAGRASGDPNAMPRAVQSNRHRNEHAPGQGHQSVS